MADLLPENLWVNLTVVIPGLVTYGSWRLALLSRGSWRIGQDLLSKIDESAVLSVSIVTAIAILQQALAILLEPLLGGLFAIKKKEDWRKLFLGRFKVVAEGKLTEEGKRTVGQFFLSVNVLVGQVYLLLYFLLFEDIDSDCGLVVILYCFIFILVLVCIFRAYNAKEAISGQSKG